MKPQIFPFLLSLLLLAGFTACNNAGGNQDAQQAAVDTTKQVAPPVQIALAPFPASPEFTDAALKSMKYKAGKFTYTVSGSTYKLGDQTPDAPQKMCANSDKGQHIHLIIDNEPYIAKYTADFEQDVADGEHYVLSFLSRSYHESIKTAQTHIAKKVMVKDKAITKSEDIAGPMLFYSRPKGDYVGQAETGKVMLDFYLVNTTLAPDGNKVKVLVNNGQEFTLDKWEPVFLEGLPMGDNKIQLTLIDATGKTVEAPLNPVERVFTLKAGPAEGQ